MGSSNTHAGLVLSTRSDSGTLVTGNSDASTGRTGNPILEGSGQRENDSRQRVRPGKQTSSTARSCTQLGHCASYWSSRNDRSAGQCHEGTLGQIVGNSMVK